jgi:hypothetical protein
MKYADEKPITCFRIRKFCHDIEWVIDEEKEESLGIVKYKEKRYE